MSTRPRLSVRIDLPGGGRLGPGKAALLAAIAGTGSIRAAADQLSMSYPKALKLIEQMNGDFEDAVAASHHGGQDRGGTRLTPFGAWLLGQYRAVCAAAEIATEDTLDAIGKRLAKKH